MEIILFILLVGVWAAFVLPSFVNSRRETNVTDRQTGDTSQRVPVRSEAPSARERVLARRRNALVGLGFAAVATLVLAILTGSVFVLMLSLLVDVALAAYIAVLLQIKQSQTSSMNRHGQWEDSQQVRVVSR